MSDYVSLGIGQKIMKKVVSYIKDTKQLDIDMLFPFQGNTKELSQQNRYKLRREILETGFSFAFHVWKLDDRYYIIDGHQRLSVLKGLRKEGYEIPAMTCNLIQADNIKEAKARVLQAISQYGKLNRKGLDDFIGDDFDDFEMDERFDFPDFDFNFDTDDDKPQEEATGAKELDEDNFKEFEHECPKCGFEFNDETKDRTVETD